jgi:hypothetical protein
MAGATCGSLVCVRLAGFGRTISPDATLLVPAVYLKVVHYLGPVVPFHSGAV